MSSWIGVASAVLTGAAWEVVLLGGHWFVCPAVYLTFLTLNWIVRGR